ncbi:hypothetical protein [Coraliomargarita parva]|uniref:hypothetical protein n=1 Tax=Coraliomargarita parva TaxID=3014050 RepID=UPI0022B439F3|nr:hypothetical protein [Coraliomargarita parva]
MHPRSLRHRMEKAAKLLVIIQKHTPEVDCLFAPEKGEQGHVVCEFSGSGMSRSNILQLGKDLEARGYQFTRKANPWLGQLSYTGKADEKPTIILSLPVVKDRVAINEDTPATPYSFKEA